MVARRIPCILTVGPTKFLANGLGNSLHAPIIWRFFLDKNERPRIYKRQTTFTICSLVKYPSSAEGGERHGVYLIYVAVAAFSGGYYVDWNSLLFQFCSDAVFCRDRGDGPDGRDSETRAARSVVVSLGRDVHISRWHLPLLRKNERNGRGGFLFITLWHHHYRRRLARYRNVLKCVVSHFAQSADCDRVGESSRLGWAGLTDSSRRRSSRRAHVEN